MFEAVLDHSPKPTDVYLVNELDSDRMVRARAAKFAGSVLLSRLVEINDSQPLHSLLDGINSAAMGDEQAYNMVRANVATDVIERTLKAGFVLNPVHLELGEDKSLSQYGQSYLSIQANSLIQAQNHPVMLARTKAENNNGFRIEDLARSGGFDNHSMVIFSLAEDLAECGFYTDTMSCSIQLVSKDKEGLAITSAFVAGKDGNVFDHRTVVDIYQKLTGRDISQLSNAEILDSPLLINNSLIPNGVVDVVKMYDESSGGTFFGLNQPAQDYLKYEQQCHRREEGYSNITDKIVKQLIKEADQFKTPKQASMRLNDLSQHFTVEKAVYDRTIDPRVFGVSAARYIDQAREAYEHGEINGVFKAITLARKTAVSSSCPTPSGLSAQSTESISGGEDKYGSLTFYCPNGHLNTRPKNKLIDKCQTCKINVKCDVA